MNELRNVTLSITEWYFIKRLVKEVLDEYQETEWYDLGDFSILDNINSELQKQLEGF